jgi:hypothetical protein
MSKEDLNLSCGDYLQFKRHIQDKRKLDDQLTYEINVNLPTQSFQEKQKVNLSERCKDIYFKMKQIQEERMSAIRTCIGQYQRQIDQIRSQTGSSVAGDSDSERHLRTQLRTMRLLQTDLSEEEVMRRYSSKLFYERCRDYFKPPDYDAQQ